MNSQKKKIPLALIPIIVIILGSSIASLFLLFFPSIIFKILGILIFIGMTWIGVNLIKLKNNARIAAVALFSLAILADIILLIMQSIHPDTTVLVRTIVGAIIIAYLVNKDTIKLFEEKK